LLAVDQANDGVWVVQRLVGLGHQGHGQHPGIGCWWTAMSPALTAARGLWGYREGPSLRSG
jgi:hypothetical protein